MVVKQGGGQIGSGGKRCPCSTLVKQKMVKRDTLTIIKDDGRTQKWSNGLVANGHGQTVCASNEVRVNRADISTAVGIVVKRETVVKRKVVVKWNDGHRAA